ncbi:hypothetical protein K439DRAFT_1648725 [Ramaria rubella]|nr:hypothetical protein K439DRAFT_1648725 [Ramaria rubella]
MDKSGKAKVWCMLCYADHLAHEVSADESLVLSGKREMSHSKSVIENMMWSQSQEAVGRGWLVSRTITLQTHLRDCLLQPNTVRIKGRDSLVKSPHRSGPTINIGEIPPVPWPQADTQNPMPEQWLSSSSLHPHQSSFASPSDTFRVPSPAPKWLAFCENFEFKESAKEKIWGCEGTATCDGWTGENKHHFIAFMVTCNGQTHTVRVHDASAERKTAENLYNLMVEVINELQDKWNVTVVAFTSDAGGESLKACKMVRVKYPHIVTADCYAHQINLIVGDFFKSAASFLHEVANSAPTLTVIRAVLTRWTCHYLAYHRLLDLRLSLQTLVDNDERLPTGKRQPVLGDRDAQAKSHINIAIIKSSTFWHALARMKNHLEPLAVAANVTQAANCRVDQVLSTFVFLHICYSALLDPEDTLAQNAILSSIERRWSKTDQDVFIAGIFLNPFHKARPFCAASFSTMAGLYSLLFRLWRQFYYGDPPAEFYLEFTEYVAGSGNFACMDNLMQGMMALAELEVHYVYLFPNTTDNLSYCMGRKSNPLDIWAAISHPNHPLTPLVRLARCILTICPNSASVECLWSVFGTILTRLWTRLGNNALVTLAELKLYLREEHLHAQAVHTRLKRHFGTNKTSVEVEPTSQATDSAAITSESAVGSSMSTETAMNSDANDIATPHEEPWIDTIVGELVQAVEEDNSVVSTPPSSSLSIPLTDLFDFSQIYWIEAYEKLAMHGLQDELELYELFDLDADGDTVEDEAYDALNE